MRKINQGRKTSDRDHQSEQDPSLTGTMVNRLDLTNKTIGIEY